jgi:hypothetical protein
MEVIVGTPVKTNFESLVGTLVLKPNVAVTSYWPAPGVGSIFGVFTVNDVELIGIHARSPALTTFDPFGPVNVIESGQPVKPVPVIVMRVPPPTWPPALDIPVIVMGTFT